MKSTFRKHHLMHLVMGMATVWSLLLGISCRDGKDPESGTVVEFVFVHKIDGAPAVFDAMQYINQAGNPYEVTEVQWFISDVMLGDMPIPTDDGIHYIDTNVPSTLRWSTQGKHEISENGQLTFTFGLKGDKNTVGRFTDQPESNMIWPYHMGGDQGGYHYMKLNGFWTDTSEARIPFNFHLGVGKVMNADNSASFVQNWFEVTLPLPKSQYLHNDTLTVPVTMNIENWFQDPHTWDFDVMGGTIMNNQTAMKMGCENGAADVFSLGDIHDTIE